MKEELQKIELKIDKLDTKLDSVDTHLAVYNEQLKIHIKRTELIEQDLLPIKAHVHQLKGAAKLVAIVASCFTILTILYNLFKG